MNNKPRGRSNKRQKLLRTKPVINSAEHLLWEDFNHEDDGDVFEFDDEIDVNNDSRADKSYDVKDIYHDYLHTKRLKFDDYCAEQREYLRRLRQRCLEIQQKRGCRFHIDPPVNRFADIPMGDPKWRICDPESLPPVVDYTAEVWQHFNRFYFEPEQSDLSTLFKGVCIFVNGYTNPIASHLHTLMLFTGGHYTLIFDRHRTTHTIATILSSAQMKSERTRNTTVRPEWIIESLRARKLLPLHVFLVHQNLQDIRGTFARITRQLEQQQQQQEEKVKKYRSSNPIIGIKNGFMNLTYKTYEVDSNEDFEPNLLKLLNELDNDKHSTPISKRSRTSSSIGEPGPSTSVADLPCQTTEAMVPLTFNTSDYMPGSTHELDSGLLNELPDDIRKEVIGYARNKQQQNNQPKTIITKISNKPAKTAVKNSKPTKKAMENDNVNRASDLFFGRIVGMKANICGKTNVQDVGLLIDEWICTTTEELNDMDILYVIRFLLELADEKRYDDLIQILYDMKECIQQNCNPEQPSYQEWQFFFTGTLCTVLMQESSIPEGFLTESLFTMKN